MEVVGVVSNVVQGGLDGGWVQEGDFGVVVELELKGGVDVMVGVVSSVVQGD